MTTSIQDRLTAWVQEGRIEADAAQLQVAKRLDLLAEGLMEQQLARKGSALGWLFRRKDAPGPVRGLYVWGGVGRGKTMLMDLFFEQLPVRAKKRTHFHTFMRDVHARIHLWRQAARTGKVEGSDPVAPVAEALAKEAQILCFDEFSVTDIADAMLLGRLFEGLFARGVTIVATSNVEPDTLYKDGLNRALFLPFIHLLRERMDVLRLDARTDYRLEKLAGAAVYHVPADAGARVLLNQMFESLTGVSRAGAITLSVQGRALTVEKAAGGVGWVQFDDLCSRPLGASDYLEVARAFHTLFIEGVPVMGQAQRNEAKRFITLIDILYDAGVKTVISADAPAESLYRGEQGAEVFEFDRTVSRLIEMRSHDYLARPHGRGDSVASGDTTGLVET